MLEGWRVEEVAGGKESGIVRVKGPMGEVTARSVVICPGPWAPSLLHDLGINLPLQ